jgi:hypothetical protein
MSPIDILCPIRVKKLEKLCFRKILRQLRFPLFPLGKLINPYYSVSVTRIILHIKPNSGIFFIVTIGNALLTLGVEILQI